MATAPSNLPECRAGRQPWAVVVALAALAALLLAGWLSLRQAGGERGPITVGILHSRTGPMAVSEQAIVDAEVLALEEINRAGGLLGRPVRWVIADGASDDATFAREARRLIRDEGATVLFGCCTSSSRKSVLPALEADDHLLVYPMAHEGLEQSPYVIYVGAAPNQQLSPAVQWCHEKLGARRFFLVGSDYVWPRCANAIVSDLIAGLGAEKVGEAYVPFGSVDVGAAVKAVVDAKPDVVLSTVVGESAIAFAKALRASGVRPDAMPVVTFAIGENELRDLPRAEMAGDHAAWGYFQSLPNPENQEFVRAFRERYGRGRSVEDSMASAYSGVRLWAQAVAETGTPETRQVRQAMRRQSMASPLGTIAVDPETQHTWRPASIGRARVDGQFEVVWTTRTPVRPIPFPRTRTTEQWEKFLADLQAGWGGRWSAPDPVASSGGPGG